MQSKSMNFNFGHFGQNTKVIALLFGQKSLIFITFQYAIKINEFQCLVIFGQNTKAIALTFLAKHRSFSSLFNLQSKSMNFNFGQFWAKYQGYSLTFWPKSLISSLFNLQSKSMNFNFGHFWAKYQGYSLTFLAKHRSFSSLFNLQSKSMNFNFGQF